VHAERRAQPKRTHAAGLFVEAQEQDAIADRAMTLHHHTHRSGSPVPLDQVIEAASGLLDEAATLHLSRAPS
jgi:hypothetical protein